MWLARRDACGGNGRCLADMMRARIGELSAAAPPPAPAQPQVPQQAAPGVTGMYCTDRNALRVIDSGATATIAFLTFNDIGHSCGFAPVNAQRSGNGWVAQDGACAIYLWTQGAHLMLEARPSHECTPMYCGARIQIGRYAIPLASRVPGSEYDRSQIDTGEMCGS
jgi:hypothetical protein